jgi:hypothetical protein
VIVSAVVVMKAITVPSNTNPNPRKLQPIKVVVVLPSGLTVSSALPGTQMYLRFCRHRFWIIRY